MRNALLIVAAVLVTSGAFLFRIDLGLIVGGALLGTFVLLSE